MTAIDTSTEAVERLLDGVTPGPWTEHDAGKHPHVFVCGPDQFYYDGEIGDKPLVAYVTGVEAIENRVFIAAARDLVPALLKERDDLQVKLAEAQAELHGPIKHLSAQDYSNVIAHLSPELEPNGKLPNRNSLMMALVEKTYAAREDAVRAERDDLRTKQDAAMSAGDGALRVTVKYVENYDG